MGIYEPDFNMMGGKTNRLDEQFKNPKMKSTEELIDSALKSTISKVNEDIAEIKNKSEVKRISESGAPIQERQQKIRKILEEDKIIEIDIEFLLNYIAWSPNEKKYYWANIHSPQRKILVQRYLT